MRPKRGYDFYMFHDKRNPSKLFPLRAFYAIVVYNKLDYTKFIQNILAILKLLLAFDYLNGVLKNLLKRNYSDTFALLDLSSHP